MEDRWAAAMKAGDAAALTKICVADLIYGHSSGAVQTRQDLIDSLRSGRRRYDSIAWESFKAAPHGDAVITHSVLRIKGKNDQGEFDDHLMMMHVWVKAGGAWQLAGHQTARLP